MIGYARINRRRVLLVAVLLILPCTGALLPHGVAASEPTAEYTRHLRALLESGFGETPADLHAAERHYEAACRVCPDDPRTDYAYGLVLLKGFKHSHGITHIQQAAEAQPPYLPATRAVIRESIRRNQYDAAVEQLVDLGKLLGPSQADDPPDPQTVETARWIGVAIGFMAGPADLDSAREHAVPADVVIQKLLDGPLRINYDQGKLDVQAQAAQWQLELQSAEALAEQKQQKEQSEATAKVEEFQQRQEQLQEAKEEQAILAADTTSEMDATLDQLADRFDVLSKSVTSLLTSIQATQLDIQRLKSLLETADDVRSSRLRGRGNVPRPADIEAQILARSKELQLYLAEYANAVTARAVTARQGQALLARRMTAEAHFRKTSAAAGEQANRIQQWNERLTRAMQEAKQSSPRTPRMRSVLKRSRSFLTYDRFDLDEDQRRLLASLEPPEN